MAVRMATGERSRGFTYLSLLLFVAVLGVGLAASAMSWETGMRRQKEQELLFIGAQFQEAIALYYNSTPGEVREYPKRLEDLVRDARRLTVERYLRRIYSDPLTGKIEWGIVAAPEGGIMGVYSLAKGTPMRSVEFAPAEPGRAATYQDWKFIARR